MINKNRKFAQNKAEKEFKIYIIASRLISPKLFININNRRPHPNPAGKLEKVQNKCLRTVTGAYKATPIAVLEMETYTPPLDLYLNARLAKFCRQHKESGMKELVIKACI